MLEDPSFYWAAIPAVILVGMSKGGMGDALGLLGVPIMAMAVDPRIASAIMLPILLVMDCVSLWMWRKNNDRETLKIMLPGGLLGLAFGWVTFVWMPAYVMRLIIGIIAVSFSARFFVNMMLSRPPGPPRQHDFRKATFWATISGYGSFVAHSGGAPWQVYGLPLRLPPASYTGATVRFFALMNAIKLFPYWQLGLIDLSNLKISATLFPLAPIATIAGAMVVKRMKVSIFYPFMYAMVGLAGLKLLYDGVKPLVASLM